MARGAGAWSGHHRTEAAVFAAAIWTPAIPCAGCQYGYRRVPRSASNVHCSIGRLTLAANDFRRCGGSISAQLHGLGDPPSRAGLPMNATALIGGTQLAVFREGRCYLHGGAAARQMHPRGEPSFRTGLPLGEPLVVGPALMAEAVGRIATLALAEGSGGGAEEDWQGRHPWPLGLVVGARSGARWNVSRVLEARGGGWRGDDARARCGSGVSEWSLVSPTRESRGPCGAAPGIEGSEERRAGRAPEGEHDEEALGLGAFLRSLLVGSPLSVPSLSVCTSRSCWQAELGNALNPTVHLDLGDFFMGGYGCDACDSYGFLGESSFSRRHWRSVFAASGMWVRYVSQRVLATLGLIGKTIRMTVDLLPVNWLLRLASFVGGLAAAAALAQRRIGRRLNEAGSPYEDARSTPVRRGSWSGGRGAHIAYSALAIRGKRHSRLGLDVIAIGGVRARR